jgi:CubicO group peptidase (beta-lactamase class C family)
MQTSDLEIVARPWTPAGPIAPAFAVLTIGWSLVFLLTLNETVAYSQAPQRNVSDVVDAYVKKQMQDRGIPGLSLAVVRGRIVLKTTGYGLENVETNTAATPDTAYKAASLSKPFIAAAIMLLVQDGKVGLDDKVGKYLDDAPDTWKDITIQHLLTHTSGLVRDPPEYHPYEELPIAAVIASTYQVPLSFRPGAKWLYSNIGYYALAEIITRDPRAPGKCPEIEVMNGDEIRTLEPMPASAVFENSIDSFLPGSRPLRP